MKNPSTMKAAILFSFLVTTFCADAQFGRGGFQQQQRQDRAMMDAYRDGRSAGQQMRGYLGYEVGVFYSFADRNFVVDYADIDDHGVNHGMLTYKHKWKPKFIGFAASSYVNLAGISSKSCLAFDWGISAIIMKDETGTLRYNIDSMRRGYIGEQMWLFQMGVPFLLDYKYGGEAIYDKAEGFSLTLGAGLQPTMVVTGVAGMGKIAGSIVPTLKAEIGFFAGLQWKIKASYLLQSGALFKIRPADGEGVGKGEPTVISVTTQPAINIGISFMPFSYDWDNTRW